MQPTEDQNWPRVSQLPKSEQRAFERWLDGQTRPVIGGVLDDEQDGYFPWDYDRWKGQQK